MIIDATRSLTRNNVVYPGDIPPEFHQEDHGRYLLSALHMSTHSGTHIDAPSHYLKDSRALETIPFEFLIGQCRVIDLTEVTGPITAAHLEKKIRERRKILIKTNFSNKSDFDEHYVALSMDGAASLLEAGIHCVGIDSPSIEPFSGDGGVHRLLLERGTAIIELVDLSAVKEGDYWMVALPLRLDGLDGSPCRILLATEENKGVLYEPYT
ncbi:MAG TPA: cyclase family protein [Methanoregulaceae archaeon]|nr:cyclase family protein [Methanoregulaceae archaeon]